MTLGGNYVISADFPGVYASAVEAALPGAVAMFLNGASGDVNPPAMNGIRTTRACGLSLAGETLKLLGSLMVDRVNAASTTFRINWCEKALNLPLGQLPSKEELLTNIAEYEARLNVLRSSSHGETRGLSALREWALGCVREIEGGEPVPHRHAANVQTVNLGDAAWVFIPGELFVELGRKIKQSSPFSHTHVVGYANGWVGYLPTVDAVALGGYEPTAYRYWQSRPLVPEAGEIIVREAISQLGQCKRAIDARNDHC